MDGIIIVVSFKNHLLKVYKDVLKQVIASMNANDNIMISILFVAKIYFFFNIEI